MYDSGGAETLMKNIQGMKSIHNIVFNMAPFSNTGMQYLATLPNLRKLVVIGGRGVTDVGLAYLRGCLALEVLSLRNTDVTDKGLAVLGDIPKLHSLVLVDDKAGGSSLTKAGFKHLKNLTNLRTLTLGGNWVSEAAVRDLQTALPNCKIHMGDKESGDSEKKKGVGSL